MASIAYYDEPAPIGRFNVYDGAAVIYEIAGTNVTAGPLWIMVFDDAAVPDDGAKPLENYLVPPNGNFSRVFQGPLGDKGRRVVQGIGFSWSSQPGLLLHVDDAGPVFIAYRTTEVAPP